MIVSNIVRYVTGILNNITKTKLKPQNLLEVLNSMVKYKANLKFKEDGKSLNEIITEALKIEIKKKFLMTCNNLKVDLPCNCNHYSKNGRSYN